MSKFLNDFITWFNNLSPDQKSEIVSCIYSNYGQQNTANFDGFFAGQLPSQGSNPCPTCGKPR
jgi:hypothetical protein